MLDHKKKYLQIALNSTLSEAQGILSQITLDERILIEVGTPMIKRYGEQGIATVRSYLSRRLWSPQTGTPEVKNLFDLYKALKKKGVVTNKKPTTSFEPYVVADAKCMDRGLTEVEIALRGGANAVTALGTAPIETLDAFIEACDRVGLDAMIDMMNVEFPLGILRKLKKPPAVVILHRGVDETEFNKEKMLPFHEINRVKGQYNILIAVAGGDTIREVQRAIFNNADIVVVWKEFYQSTVQTAELAREFLKEIR